MDDASLDPKIIGSETKKKKKKPERTQKEIVGDAESCSSHFSLCTLKNFNILKFSCRVTTINNT